VARRDFRLLLLGQTTSQFGAQLSAVAIPLLAVISLHATPWQLGIVNASGTLAFAVIGLPVGAWIDRVRRRPVLIASDLIRSLLLGVVPVAWWLGRLDITQLIVVSLLTGAARVFFDVGYQSYLPTVTGPDRVLAGNSAMEAVRASGQVVGPGIGGWLVAAVGAACVVLVQAATFLASALSLLAIRVREPRRVDAERPRIRDGLRFVARTRVLRAMAITSATSNFGFAMASAVTVIFLSRTLQLSAGAIGALFAVGGAAALIGAAATPWLARRLGSARIVWLALVVTGPITLLGVLARPGWLVGLFGLATLVGEIGQIVYAISSVSLRQQVCPPGMLGRVNATMRFVIMGLFPAGALLGGGLASAVGTRVTLAVALGLGALAPLPSYLALRGGPRPD
jgi:predicted MFS family arabinose efflux permease